MARRFKRLGIILACLAFLPCLLLNSNTIALDRIPDIDAWQYDKNNSCYIEKEEATQAVNDYSAGVITKEQAVQAVVLYFNHTRNPACEDELLTRLKSGEIGANWWNYSTTKRWEIAHYVGEYSANLPIGEHHVKGAKECAGAPFYSKYKNKCYAHVAIRYSLIGDTSTCSPTGSGSGFGCNCFENYWQDKDGSWHCFYNPESFNLPLHWGSLIQRWFTTPPNTPLITHSICALLVESDYTNIDSWLFFQYTDAEIKPLDTSVITANHMEVGTLVAVREVVAFNGLYNIGIKDGDPLAGWEITEAGAIPYYGPWEK